MLRPTASNGGKVQKSGGTGGGEASKEVSGKKSEALGVVAKAKKMLFSKSEGGVKSSKEPLENQPKTLEKMGSGVDLETEETGRKYSSESEGWDSDLEDGAHRLFRVFGPKPGESVEESMKVNSRKQDPSTAGAKEAEYAELAKEKPQKLTGIAREHMISSDGSPLMSFVLDPMTPTSFGGFGGVSPAMFA
ncbi:hypothetical protein SCOR_05190 [Sulfidibacter corallicola]|uniref:Uncharacterized protein n=1 Tax=Sulfidibacter corallicola TaxID=2818388 RepID=A0A8A4TRY9_SULCO|nr:hypothetical protein [Sulfidibacter corallicola]QTD51832.1 hypothetical protein J3U87_05120 [Sulfidibacter corallicola]